MNKRAGNILICFLLTVLPTIGCSENMTAIDESTAKKLAIDKYQALYSNLYYFNPVDSKYIKFPALDVSYFHNVSRTDCCWLLRAEPPAGIFLVARVDIKGTWVDIEKAGFASE